MKKHIFPYLLAALIPCFGLHAEVPQGYYDSLEGKSGLALRKAVKDLAIDHTVIHYGDSTAGNEFYPAEIGTWTVFKLSDVRLVDGHLCWWDMYSANNVQVSNGHPGLNIEHSVANSWWGGQGGSKEAYNDLHHLNPSNGDANGQKSNWPLGEIQGSAYWTNGVATTGTPKSGMGGGATRVFEPHKVYKGDFARAYFYIFSTYDAIPWKIDYAWMYDASGDDFLQPWAVELLLKWAAEDPVSAKETNRNDAVYSRQNNRNPFIDCPNLAEHIWGSKKNEPFHYTPYTAPADDTEYPGYDEVFAEMTKGQWMPVKSNADLSENENYFIVTPTKNRAMTYTLISTGKALDECAVSPLRELVTYPEIITGVPEEIATVRLEKDGDGWYVGVYDGDGAFKGYVNVTSKNTATLSSSKAASCKATIKAEQERTVITYTLSDGNYSLQYNSGNPRFAAYTSTQNPILLYRVADKEYSDPVDAGVGGPVTEEDYDFVAGIYDINGRKMSATSVSELGKGIYIVVGRQGARKIIK